MSLIARMSPARRPGRRLVSRVVLCLLAVCAGPASRAHAGEVVENFDDGSPKVKYLTNEQGQKEGRYLAFHRNGKIAIDTTYRADRIDGAYAEYFEDGKPRLRASYKAGKKAGHYEVYGPDGDVVLSSNYADDRLNGKLEAFRGKKTASIQTWREGELVTLDGVTAYPRTLDGLRATVAAILAGDLGPATPVANPKAKPRPRARKPDVAPAPASSPPSAELVAQRTGALRRLAVYRFLCGAPYEGLTLEEEPNAYAQAAAELCARIGRIDHEPPNPGLSEEQFHFAEKGTKSCNLAQRQDAIHAIDGYMDDSDFANEKKIGHRRWCLNPGMLVTGFGCARGGEDEFFSAMWAMDESRNPVPDYDAVCYPARGWMPIDLFGKHRVWSVSLQRTRFPNVPKDGVDVRVYRLGADFVRPETPIELDLLAVDSGIGAGTCVSFRPKTIDLVDGAAYWVEISGLEAKPKPKKPGEHPKSGPDVSFHYLTHFSGPVMPVPPDASPDESK